jgi:hypothetical protein
MSKPETIRYDKYGVFIDGIQMERITGITLSGDFGTENILQLADSGIVQKISQSPEISLSIESNFIGSTDNLRLVTDRVINYSTCSSTADCRKQRIKGWQTYDRISAASANSSYKDVDQLDMLNSYVDITIPIGYGSTSLGKTLHLHRFGLTGYSLTQDVGGNATESFTLTGANRYWFSSVWRGVRCYPLRNGEISTKTSTVSGGLTQDFVFMSSAIFKGATVIGFFYGVHTAFVNNSDDWTFLKTSTAIVLPAGRTGRTKWRLKNISVSDPNSSWANPFVSSPHSPTREKAYILWRHAASSQTYAGGSTGNWGFELTHSAGTLGAVARQYTELYLWNSADATGVGNKFLRVQGFTLNVSPESENKYQLGEKEAYSIFRKTPVAVTGTFSVLASDLEPTYLLSGYHQEPNMLTSDDFNAYNHMKVKFYQDESRTIALSSVMVRNFTVSNESYSISVGGEGAEEFNFEADNFQFKGTGQNPNQGT